MFHDLLSSHPDIQCRPVRSLVDDDRVSVGYIQHERIGDLLNSPAKKIVLTRGCMTGADSETRGTHVSDDVVLTVARRRKTQTARLLAHADFVVSYEDMTGGKEISSIKLDDLCKFLGVTPKTLTTTRRKDA